MNDLKAHTLPAWFEWVQDHFFLSALIVAEAYLLGDLMQRGWVANIESPETWGRYHGVGVVLFFAAGAMAAGVALGCSVKASAAFTRRLWGRGLFNFTGVLVFSICEVWASLSERSANLAATPADHAVLGIVGWQGWPVSPTVLIVALLLPFTTIYYGFARQQIMPSAEQLEAEAQQQEVRQAAELAKARHNAQLRVVQAAGVRHAVAAGLGREEPDGRPPTGPGTPTAMPPVRTPREAAADAAPEQGAIVLQYPPEWRTGRNKRARTYSAERRVFALLEREPLLSAHAIAKRLRVSESTASKYARVWRERHAGPQQMAQ
ncbi:MAG TPA: hypothetical protein VGR57_09410 [Ktedonobacterales bacterium]|nr:hypothetical protein [Ktedonobacterales bacterium]